MSNIDDLLDRVRARLRAPESCGVGQIDVIVADALRPGKLLRPGMVVRSALAAGADLDQPGVQHAVVEGALAMELLHVATLVHDDIIDGADLRRGRPSVVARSDVSTAIVVGDLLLARGSTAAASSAPGVSASWSRALDRMAAGQLREAGLVESPSLEAQAEYASLKTAELFRSCAETGALAAGAGPEVIAAHGLFGLHFGRAFQHVDDLLDLYGDPIRTGKHLGADAGNGVPTPLSLLTGPRALDDVVEMVAAELDRARSSLPPDPRAAAMCAWGVSALGRAALAALDGGHEHVAARLTTVLGRSELAPRPRMEAHPCHDSLPA